MHTDLDALIWEFRSSMTLHRVSDARKTLDQALQIAQLHGADRATRFTLALDAATLAQLMGDLVGARRYYGRLAETNSDDALHRFWWSCHLLRQAALLGRLDEAASQTHCMLVAAASPAVGPARQSAALAELAWVQARLGRFAESISLYETACEGLANLGSHPEWAALYCFELARVQVQAARADEERALGHLEATTAAARGTAVALWRRATASLDEARRQHAPGYDDGLLAKSAIVLREVTLSAGHAPESAIESLTALMQGYDSHQMAEPFIWSACELSRLQIQCGDTGAALATLARARLRLPPTGHASMRERLDFLCSIAYRQQGDHRRGLIAYQCYAQAAFSRRSGVPAALHDGTLSDLARRLGGTPRRRHFPARVERSRETASPAVANSGRIDVAEAPWVSLSHRQQEILYMAGEGLNNRQIASLLDLSPFTIRNHLASAFRTLKVRSRAEAIAFMPPRHRPAEVDSPSVKPAFATDTTYPR